MIFEQQLKNRLRSGFPLMVLCAAAAMCAAQAQPAQGTQQTAPQNQAPDNKPKAPQDSNPFPTDTDAVPVMPNADSPGTPPAVPDNVNTSNIPLPGELSDPVKSPEDAGPEPTNTTGGSSSSSGLEDLLRPPPDVGKNGKKGASDEDDGMPHDSAKEDETVGAYYLETKNWKGAISRFESALVLDPENPDVFWGLAEAQRHLGSFAEAKANYLTVLAYDPDSKHAKEAKKILAQPEMASAKSAAVTKPAGQARQ